MKRLYSLAIGLVLYEVFLVSVSRAGYSYGYKPCIVGKHRHRRDVYADAEERMSEIYEDGDNVNENDPHYHPYPKPYPYTIYKVRLQVLHRCGYNLCNSFGAKIFIFSTKERKLCHVRKYSKRYRKGRFVTVTCRVSGFPKKVVIDWRPIHKRRARLIITKIRTRKTIRAIKPKSHLFVIDYSYMKYCRKIPYIHVPKTILITDKIQGVKCPTGRLRFPVGSVQSFKVRTLDGRLNNKKMIFLGAAGENLIRLAPNGYVDGISIPTGACTPEQLALGTCPFPAEFSGLGSNRPNARVISNVLLRQNKVIPSPRGLSDMITYWGQFIDHDISLTEELPEDFEGEKPTDVELPIAVPKGDVIFDPDRTGVAVIPLRRFNFDMCTGNAVCKCPRSHITVLSSFIDANTVYGTNETVNRGLRTLVDGRLIEDNGFLPLNTLGLPNQNPLMRDPTMLRVAGDVRSNTAPTLFMYHSLFLREHNRQARIFRKKFPAADDETIFQLARGRVIAEVQAITYNEYLPSLVGGLDRIPKYKGYNQKVDPSVATEFSGAAFRIGHTQLSQFVFRFDENGKIIKFGNLLLREGFFRPERITEEGGLDPVIRGAIFNPSQDIDTNIIDEIRNFLFVTNVSSLDLASINIQRGRELGIPDLNTVRKSIGLKKFKSFNEITSDRKVANTLRLLYKDINNVDLWVGGIAEDAEEGSELGETFRAIIVDQFVRVRDGDRFFYLNILSKKEIEEVEATTLSEIVRLNTGVADPPTNVFFSTKLCKAVKDFQCVRRLAYH